MKTYLTFGQDHVHPDLDVDKDTVLVIEGPSEEDARNWFFDHHGSTFCFSYDESRWDEGKMMQYFPKGYRYATTTIKPAE